MADLKFEEESYRIRGAIFEVEREFAKQGIPFVALQELVLQYKGDQLAQTYKPDFICYEQIIAEIKAMKELANEHRTQVHNYLKAICHEFGLLVNFGHYPKVEIERIVK